MEVILGLFEMLANNKYSETCLQLPRQTPKYFRCKQFRSLHVLQFSVLGNENVFRYIQVSVTPRFRFRQDLLYLFFMAKAVVVIC
jgi:hypothetical protein